MLLGTFFLAAIFTGLLLAGAPVLLILAMGGVAWLLLLPYHAQIAVVMATATFASAVIVPGLPGRPFVWEAAAILGWTGVGITLALRKQAPESAYLIRRNWLLLVGGLSYCAVLIMLMYYRGVGVRVFGGSQMGGRIYLQQLACAIFPLLFALKPLTETQLLRLFTIQCLLSVTFIIADLSFSYGGDLLMPLLYVLELPVDGINFESQSMGMGIRRFQSLFFFSLATLSLLWTRRPLSDYFTRHGLWLWPLTLGLMGMGLLGGHRYLIYLLTFIVVISAWTQRFLTPVRVIGISLVAVLLFVAAAANIRNLPLAAQRALSIVPGLHVDRQAEDDGRNTLEGRRAIRQAGLEAARDHRWIGRGFGKPINVDSRFYHDRANAYVDMGIFYNGTVGLLVNTGLPGTATMFLFLFAGTVIVVRVLRHVRRYGAGDPFSRMCCILAATWIGQLTSFIFLHGDSEFAMRTFALQAAVLLLCDHHLRQRRLAFAKEVEAAKEETPIPAPAAALPEPQTA